MNNAYLIYNTELSERIVTGNFGYLERYRKSNTAERYFYYSEI